MSISRSKARISNCFMANLVFKNCNNYINFKLRNINFKNHYVEVTFIDDYNTIEILTLGPFVSEQELSETISFVNNFIEKDFTCKSRQ